MGFFDVYPSLKGSSEKKHRYFNGELYLRDRTSSRKSGLKTIGESAKENGVFKSYRIVKEKGKYALYIKP